MIYTKLYDDYRGKKVIGACYELYLFFLLLGRVGIGGLPQPLRQYVFNSTSSVFLYIGVLLLVVSGRGKVRYPERLKMVTKLMAYFVIWNIIMSIVLYRYIGTQFGETTFTAILGTTYHYIEAAVAIGFNVICLSYYITQQKVFRILLFSSIIALGVGWLQQMVYWKVPTMLSLYKALVPILGLSPESTVLKRGFSCFGSEPAEASQCIMIAFPLLVSCILSRDQGYPKKLCTVVFLLFIVLFFTSTSSTTVALLVIFCISLFVILIKRKKIVKIWMYTVFLLGLVFVLAYTYMNPEIYSISDTISNDFLYIVFGKAFDTANQSVAYRFSTVIVNIKIFFSEFLLTGVGMGNQGFFYKQYVPSWCLISGETRALLSGENGISNGGGSFFSPILSGYGIFGFLVLTVFVRKYIQPLKDNYEFDQEKQTWKRFFMLGITGFLLDGWVTSGIVQNQPMTFLLSIPFIL